MGFDIFNRSKKNSAILSIQDLAKMDRFAHDLLLSPHEKAKSYQGLCQFVRQGNNVYIQPAKFDKKGRLEKKSLRAHEKGRRYVIDHFGSLVHQNRYGANEKGQSTAKLAAMHLIKLKGAVVNGNLIEGVFTLEDMCKALSPVSHAEQCIWVGKQAKEISGFVEKMDVKPDNQAKNAAHSRGRPDVDFDSRELEAAKEWGLAFLEVYRQSVSQSPEAEKFLAKKFEETKAFESFAYQKNDEPARHLTLDTFNQQVLIRPQQFINAALRDWQSHLDARPGSMSDEKHCVEAMRICVELMRLIKKTISHRAQFGNWLANELAPGMPGRLGESARALGFRLVDLSLHDLDPDSEMMRVYQWAAHNLAQEQNRMAGLKVAKAEAKVEEQFFSLITLANQVDEVVSPDPLKSPRLSPEAEKSAEQAYKDAFLKADEQVGKIENWLTQVGQRGIAFDDPDADILPRIHSAWTAFARDNDYPEQVPFDLVLREIPEQLELRWEKRREFKMAMAMAIAGEQEKLDESFYHGAIKNDQEIMALTANYIRLMAALGRFMAQELPRPEWSQKLQGDCIRCGMALMALAESMADSDSPPMLEFKAAREQRDYAVGRQTQIAERQREERLAPQRREYLGHARREQAIEKTRRNSAPSKLKRQFSQSAEAELASILGQLENMAPRQKGKPRALSQNSSVQRTGGSRPLIRRRQKSEAEVTGDRAPIEPIGTRRIDPRFTRNDALEIEQLKKLSDDDFEHWIDTLEFLPETRQSGDVPPTHEPAQIDTPRPPTGRPMNRRQHERLAPATGHVPATGEEGVDKVFPLVFDPTLPRGSLRSRRSSLPLGKIPHSPQPDSSATLDQMLLARSGDSGGLLLKGERVVSQGAHRPDVEDAPGDANPLPADTGKAAQLLNVDDLPLEQHPAYQRMKAPDAIDFELDDEIRNAFAEKARLDKLGWFGRAKERVFGRDEPAPTIGVNGFGNSTSDKSSPG